MLNPESFSDCLRVTRSDGIAFAHRSEPQATPTGDAGTPAEYNRFIAAANEDPDVRVIVVSGSFETVPDERRERNERLFGYDAGVGSGRDPNTTRWRQDQSDGRADASPRDRTAVGGVYREGDRAQTMMAAMMHDPRRLVRQPLEQLKPIVTALDGDVLGARLTGVLLSDIVIAERHVRIRDMHVTSTLVPATGAVLWPMSTGLMRAKRWLLTGDWIDAEEAERIGLVTEVVDTGGSLDRATQYATHLAALRPEILALAKRAINRWLLNSVDAVFAPALAAEMSMLPYGEDQPIE